MKRILKKFEKRERELQNLAEERQLAHDIAFESVKIN